MEHKLETVPLFVACNIVTMGSIATYLAVIPEWGGVCIDVLNVASPAAIWGEWIACGPLLIYITVTITNKPYLSNVDIFLMFCFFLCLVTGFFIIIPSSYSVGVFWLVVSCITYVPVLYLPFYDGDVFNNEIPPEKINLVSNRYAKQTNLSIWLTIVLPLYTVNYLLAMYNYYGPSTTIIIYQVLSVLTKGLFAGCTMDIHLDLLLETQRSLVEEYRVNNARRVFMKYIFHEIRNPLSSISVGIQLLKQGYSEQKSDEMESLMMMEQASNYMSETLDNVLSIQKIEEGKFELEEKIFIVNDMITDLISVYGGILRDKKIQLHFKPCPNTPRKVLGDRYRISHVMSNLISNAIKFTPIEKSIYIILECEPFYELDDNERIAITFTIRDEGVGIPEKDQKLLFNNYVQIRPGEIQKGKGSGLGLAFCKEIINLYKGKIWVESKEGEGSSFRFTLPFIVPKDGLTTKLSSGDINTLGKSTSALTHERPEEGWISNIEVMIVDDVVTNCKILSMLFKKKSIKNATSENGKIALDTIIQDQNKYKIIFMDNLMPEMTGLEASKALRKSGYPYLIIGLTGNVLEDDIQDFVEAGADLVLGKPLQVASLNKILDLVEMHGPYSNSLIFNQSII